MEIAIINVEKFFFKLKIEKKKKLKKRKKFNIKPDIRYPAKLFAGYRISGGQISIRYNPIFYI